MHRGCQPIISPSARDHRMVVPLERRGMPIDSEPRAFSARDLHAKRDVQEVLQGEPDVPLGRRGPRSAMRTPAAGGGRLGAGMRKRAFADHASTALHRRTGTGGHAAERRRRWGRTDFEGLAAGGIVPWGARDRSPALGRDRRLACFFASHHPSSIPGRASPIRSPVGDVLSHLLYGRFAEFERERFSCALRGTTVLRTPTAFPRAAARPSLSNLHRTEAI